MAAACGDIASPSARLGAGSRYGTPAASYTVHGSTVFNPAASNAGRVPRSVATIMPFAQRQACGRNRRPIPARRTSAHLPLQIVPAAAGRQRPDPEAQLGDGDGGQDRAFEPCGSAA